MATRRLVYVGCRVPERTRRQLVKLARQERRSVASYLVRVIENNLKDRLVLNKGDELHE